jgi:S-adenosylmethionine decarboxylase
MFLKSVRERKMMVYGMEIKGMKKLKLYGFNNLTKALSFNMYDICYANKSEYSKGYIEYIDEQYNADRLTSILEEVANIIGANVLNIAKQDYEPQGASVTMLISEEKIVYHDDSFDDHSQNEAPGPLPDTILAHLDNRMKLPAPSRIQFLLILTKVT